MHEGTANRPCLPPKEQRNRLPARNRREVLSLSFFIPSILIPVYANFAHPAHNTKSSNYSEIPNGSFSTRGQIVPPELLGPILQIIISA